MIAEEFVDVQHRAPSTIGTWLRGFVWATVRMLDAATRVVLARAWQAGLGPDLDADLTIDVDSTVCETYGLAKQGARFGYTKVRGYHPLLATLATTGEVLHARMRGGNAGSARGAGTFVRETIRLVRDAGATGQLTIRADSAFYSRAFIGACRDRHVRFSVTVKLLKPIREPSPRSVRGPGCRSTTGSTTRGGHRAVAKAAEGLLDSGRLGVFGSWEVGGLGALAVTALRAGTGGKAGVGKDGQ